MRGTMRKRSVALLMAVAVICFCAEHPIKGYATEAFGIQKDRNLETEGNVLQENVEENQAVMEPEFQEETQGTNENQQSWEASEQEMMAQVMAFGPENALEPIIERPAHPDSEGYKQFTYGDGFSLSGVFGTESMYFKIPSYFENVYAYAQIQFSLSQMIQDIPASMTFMVNNVPVYSCKLDYRYGRNQIVYVPIPVDLLTEGHNRFTITGYVRLYDDDGCIDDLSGANWIYIGKETFVEVGFNSHSHPKRLSDYPYPFMSAEDETGTHTQILVSDLAGEGEIAAALLLRADLSAETEKEDRIVLAKYGSRSQEQGEKNILISSYQNLPAEWKEELGAISSEELREKALVKLAEDGKGDSWLLIVSDEENCLMEAAMMLVDENRVYQERSEEAMVSLGSAQLVKEAGTASDMAAGRYTLEQITGGGITYVGPFHQSADIFLPITGGHVLSASSKISLDFRYSKNLDFTRSMITVYWGDVPVASKKLSMEKADKDELSFVMPKDVVGSTASRITVAFDLEIPELFCTPRMEEMPWAYVSGDSSLYLPLGVSGQLSFRQRPYPFEASSMFNNLLVVIPDEPGDMELDALGQVIAIYGEGITPYGDISVVRSSNFDRENTDAHVIVIGTYKDNGMLASINDRLSFPYAQDGSSFASNQQIILSDHYGENMAVMQLIFSPFGEKKGLLAICGTQEDTLSYIRDFLAVKENIYKLEKDAVLIDEEGQWRTFSFLNHVQAEEKPDLKTFFQENRESVIFSIVATSAMLLLLLAMILIMLRMYGRNRKK